MNTQLQNLIKERERLLAPAPTAMTAYEDQQARFDRARSTRAAAISTHEGALPVGYREPALPRDRLGELAPGDILHAVLQTAIHSDEPGPVRARVVGERFQGAILLGELAPFPAIVGNRPERVLVRFRTLTERDAVHEIDAYAIDPATARTALATAVDHHTLARWGGLIAASFLEGYWRAVQLRNRITTVGVFGNVVSVPKNDLDHKEVAWEAAGTVGTRLADAMGEQFNRPNTIEVASGTGIGVLILSPSHSASRDVPPSREFRRVEPGLANAAPFPAEGEPNGGSSVATPAAALSPPAATLEAAAAAARNPAVNLSTRALDERVTPQSQ